MANLDMTELQQMIMGQQSRLNTSLQQIHKFSADLEELLVKYFKDMIANLQFNVQLFIQQLLGQDVELQRIMKYMVDL